MNPPPLPQPSARTCSNCGAAIDEKVALCPHCGAPLSASQGSGCLVVGAQIFLGFLSLAFGLSGACFVLFSGGFGGGSDWQFGLIGLLALGFAALCMWGLLRLGKGRK